MSKVATSTVTSKGQVTVPEKVRRALAVGQGDRLEWVTGPDGRVEVRKAGGDLRRLVGMLGKPKRSVTVEEMGEVVKARLRERPPFHCPEGPEVMGALDDYAGGGADFSDYLILALARAAGATTLLTFDKRLLRHPACAKP